MVVLYHSPGYMTNKCHDGATTPISALVAFTMDIKCSMNAWMETLLVPISKHDTNLWFNINTVDALGGRR